MGQAPDHSLVLAALRHSVSSFRGPRDEAFARPARPSLNSYRLRQSPACGSDPSALRRPKGLIVAYKIRPFQTRGRERQISTGWSNSRHRPVTTA